jgi:glycerol uptake facilitator-like aquaporin
MRVFSKLSAEFIGTFWLVLGGCGSAVLAAAFPHVGIGLPEVSLAFGLTVLTGAHALGPISGGHFNPAVSWSPRHQRGRVDRRRGTVPRAVDLAIVLRRSDARATGASRMRVTSR